jgi:prepilin peptidase CpaA
MEIGLLVVLALICDIRTYKIKNQIVFPFVILGIITNAVSGGLNGIGFSLVGLFTPILVLILLFMLRMLGAGDVKLFAAIGAIMGAEFALYTIAYSFLAGGVIALFVLIFNKNGSKRLLYLLNYIRNCVLTFSLLPYGDFNKNNKGTHFRFAYAIACGTLVQVIWTILPRS